MTPDEKLWCLDGDAPFWAGLTYLSESGYHKSPFRAARVERLGLPGFSFSDGPRGVVVDRATCFPVSMARGATWDVDLEERIGEAIGKELRAVGADLYGGVCVNVLRHPAWGRAQETYGEDPHHVGEMGAALTRGVQRHAMACVKHFACNSMENARFTVDIAVDEAALHDVYLPHFKRIVDEGVAVVMSAYNSVNGEWCGENRVAAHRGPPPRVGLRGVRHQRLDPRPAGCRPLPPGRPRRRDALPHDPGRPPGPRRWTTATCRGPRSTWPSSGSSPPDSGSTPYSTGRARVGRCWPAPEHRALAREAAAASVVRPPQRAGGRDHPCSRWTPGRGHPSLCSAGWPPTVNLGDGGSSDVWAPEVVTVAEGLRAALARRRRHRQRRS